MKEDVWQDQLARDKELEMQQWKERGRKTKEREVADRGNWRKRQEWEKKRRKEYVQRIYKRLETMIKERNEVAKKVLTRADMPKET